MISKKTQVLFEAEFQDDIGNNVLGTVAISLGEIINKLETFGYEIKKKK